MFKYQCSMCHGVIDRGVSKCCHCGSDVKIKWDEVDKRSNSTWNSTNVIIAIIMILALIITSTIFVITKNSSSQSSDNNEMLY
jgi:hypothetical protein